MASVAIRQIGLSFQILYVSLSSYIAEDQQIEKHSSTSFVGHNLNDILIKIMLILMIMMILMIRII